MAKSTILLAGGGTAGHVNPLLATANELNDHNLICLGTSEGLEAGLVPAAGYELVPIAKIPFPRRICADLFRLPVAMSRQVKNLRQLLNNRDVDVVVGFGGYVATPAYLAAKAEGIPVVIHEQNARPGLANRLGARFAKVVALTFASTPLRARRGTTQTIGLPLRAPLAKLAHQRQTGEGQAKRREYANEFGLDPKRPIVVVTGGSLGALVLNDAIAQAAPQLPSEVQILHLTGRNKDARVREIIGDRSGYVICDYLSEMEKALGIADVVVCRAGAGTVAEICALGIPAIYVPLAIGNGEQKLNAADVVAAGGAQLIANDECTARHLGEELTKILNDDQLRTQMGQAAASCGHLDAARELARLIEGVIQ